MKKNIKSALLITLIVLALLEIILWVFSPVQDPYLKRKSKSDRLTNTYIPSQFKPNSQMVWTSDEGLPDIDSYSNFTLNNYGYRGEDIADTVAKDEFRVFLIGGSTFECLYIDDTKSIENQLQRRLKEFNAKVFNAGKSGDITPDHLSMLVHRVVHLKPKLIVLFCGINDFRMMYNNYDYTHQYKNPYTVKSPLFLNDIKLLLSNLQIYRRIHLLVKKPSIQTVTLKTNYKLRVERMLKMSYADSIPVIDLSSYERNLRSFAGICNEHSISLLLVTQATTWNSKIDTTISDYHWMSFIGHKRYDEVISEREIEKLNDIMRDIAKEKNIPLLDLSKIAPKSTEYFYDDCHFNNNGIVFFADLLSEIIKSNYQPKAP